SPGRWPTDAGRRAVRPALAFRCHVDPMVARLGEEEEAEGDEAERHRAEEPGAERLCGERIQGTIEAARIVRVGVARGADQKKADLTEDDAARGEPDAPEKGVNSLFRRAHRLR